MDGEELSEVVGGRVESPVHHEVVRSAQDVEVVLCPQEEGAAEVDGVLGVPEKKVDSAPGAEVGRGDDEVLQGRRVDRVVVQLLSDSDLHMLLLVAGVGRKFGDDGVAEEV